MKKLKEIFNRVSIWDRLAGIAYGVTAGFVLGGGHPLPAVLMGVAGFVTGGEFLSNIFNAAMFGREFAFAHAAVDGVLHRRPRLPAIGSPELN
jgi:hypothetical protein